MSTHEFKHRVLDSKTVLTVYQFFQGDPGRFQKGRGCLRCEQGYEKVKAEKKGTERMSAHSSFRKRDRGQRDKPVEWQQWTFVLDNACGQRHRSSDHQNVAHGPTQSMLAI